MRIIKPSWLSHSGEQKDFEVYSCHVSPDGQRLATAGGDGHVRIWSTDSIYNSDSTPYGKPRQLCHMSHHLGTIHSVRFSPNGKYLASGADDKFICVYHLDKGPPAATFGTNEPPPVENWKTYKRLVGHDNDVQDVAWSADSSVLASVGLDSKIVVWSGHTFERLKTISLHSSHVKGITFDPANKFFATASDDRTIKIFKFTSPAPNATQHDMASNFVLEHTISGPFKSSPLTTYFRRCSWSPDGNHIAAANAVNGPVSSVAIIERGRWDSDINLIGHEAPTEVCMFSPRLFHTRKPGEDETANGTGGNLVTVLASAGQDKTLTVWNTNTSRPVVILQDLASKSISDLSWTPDGQTLFTSGLDGTIVAVKFEVGELGWVANPEENDRVLSKYGVSRKGMGIAEDIEGMRLEELSKAGESRAAESRMGALMGDMHQSAAAAAKETTSAVNGTKGGGAAPKDAPKNDNDNGDDDKGGKKEEESAEKMAERIKELKSRVTIGKDGKKRVAPLLVSSSGTGQSSLPQTQLVGAASVKAAQNDVPQTILDLAAPYDGLPKGGIGVLLLGSKRKALSVDDEEEDEQPGGAKRAATGPVPIMTNRKEGVEPAVVSAQPPVAPTPEFLRPAIQNPSFAYAQVRLGVPKVRSHVLRPLERGVLQGSVSMEEASRVPENLILEARNPVQPRDPSAISVSKRGVPMWQDYLPKAVLLVTGNKYFWGAACEDGTVHVWSPAGRRLFGPLVLESQPVILESREHWLLCITAIGLCHVWDLRTQRSPHPPATLGPVLELAQTTLNPHGPTPAPGVMSASLNSMGYIVVTLTNGDGYFYARDMYTWQRASEAWWAVGSQYWNSNDSSLGALQTMALGNAPAAAGTGGLAAGAMPLSAGIIPHLERHTTTEFLLKGRAYTLQRIIKTLVAREGYENLESVVSIAHLENRIAVAMQLGSRDEFRLYLFMYAKRIGAEGLRGKAEELLSWLVGGLLEEEEEEEEEEEKEGRGRAEGKKETTMRARAPDHEEGRGWFGRDEWVCGWERKELLKSVVMILGKYRELQRLLVPHARLLDLDLEGDGLSMEVDA